MTTYRVGTHHGVTINREGDGHRCDRPGHDCARGHLVAVVTNGDQELAERICAALNGTGDLGRWCEQETGEKCSGLEALERPIEAAKDACCGYHGRDGFCTPGGIFCCGNCPTIQPQPASTCEGCNVARRNPEHACPRHGAVSRVAVRLVLVRGVVYKLLDRSPFPLSNPKPKYYRQSVPPDATPGKRSKWPAAYAINRLPDHEAIDEAKAREVIDASMERWRATWKETYG